MGQYFALGTFRHTETPEIFVITTTEEASEFAKTVLKADPQVPNQLQEIADKLGHIDFTRSLVVLATPGFAAPTAYRITIEHITRQDNRIVIQAQTERPRLGQGIGGAEPDPAHIVVIDKNGMSGQQMVFELRASGKPTVETSHYIP